MSALHPSGVVLHPLQTSHASFRTFVVAAVDTTSSALATTLHLLSTHPEEQGRLREELLEARHGGARELSYEELDELPFLDAVCRETLRL